MVVWCRAQLEHHKRVSFRMPAFITLRSILTPSGHENYFLFFVLIIKSN